MILVGGGPAGGANKLIIGYELNHLPALPYPAQRVGKDRPYALF